MASAVTELVESSTDLEPTLEINTLPMSEQRRWMIKVRMITRNVFRSVFGSEKSDHCWHFVDHYMAEEIARYSDWIQYPKGDSILKSLTTVYAVIVSSDGHYLFTASPENSIIKYDLLKNIQVQDWSAHEGTVCCLAYHPRGLLISGGSDTLIKVWNAFSKDSSMPPCMIILEGHTDHVTALDTNEEGTLILSGSSDFTVRVWSIDNGECQSVFHGSKVYVPFVSFIDGMILGGCAQPSIMLWDLQLKDDGCGGNTTAKRTIRKGLDCTMCDMTVNCDCSLVACMCGYGGLNILKWPSLKEVRHIHAHFQRGCFHPSKPNILAVYDWNISGSEQTIRLYNVKKKTFVRHLKGHKSVVMCLGFTPDGCRFISLSLDKTIRIWDVSDL